MTAFVFHRTAIFGALVIAMSTSGSVVDAKVAREKRMEKPKAAMVAPISGQLKEFPSIFPRDLKDAMLTQRYDEAAKLLEPIATSGKSEAMAALGSVLMNLPAATKNSKRAEKLLMDSASRGYEPAAKSLAQLYFNGDFNNGVAQYSKAWEYIYPLAQKEDSLGLYLGGRIIRDGLLGSPNDAVGRQMIFQAATRGNIEAQREIGRSSRLGETPKIDDKSPQPTAFGAMEIAAKKGNVDAAIQLGVAYLLGFGTSVDTDKARSYFELSRAQGDLTGMVLLDYLNNANSLSDDVRNKLGKAPPRAALGYAVLGRRALDGRGIEKDPADALFFALIAGYLGSPDAPEMIKTLKTQLEPSRFDESEKRFMAWRELALASPAK
jgi:TPR repeat protein